MGNLDQFKLRKHSPDYGETEEDQKFFDFAHAQGGVGFRSRSERLKKCVACNNPAIHQHYGKACCGGMMCCPEGNR